MTPTGRLDGADLELTRTFPLPIDDVWASITESDRLGRWIGTWTGDPGDGHVMFTMTSEAEPVPPTRYDIAACEPPSRLVVHAVDESGVWHLAAELVEVAGVTTLTFRQHRVDPGMVGDIGPGWEWYLDRLVAAATGGPMPTYAAFEGDYLTMRDAYAAMVTGDANH